MQISSSRATEFEVLCSARASFAHKYRLPSRGRYRKLPLERRRETNSNLFFMVLSFVSENYCARAGNSTSINFCDLSFASFAICLVPATCLKMTECPKKLAAEGRQHLQDVLKTAKHVIELLPELDAVPTSQQLTKLQKLKADYGLQISNLRQTVSVLRSAEQPPCLLSDSERESLLERKEVLGRELLDTNRQVKVLIDSLRELLVVISVLQPSAVTT